MKTAVHLFRVRTHPLIFLFCFVNSLCQAQENSHQENSHNRVFLVEYTGETTSPSNQRSISLSVRSLGFSGIEVTCFNLTDQRLLTLDATRSSIAINNANSLNTSRCSFDVSDRSLLFIFKARIDSDNNQFESRTYIYTPPVIPRAQPKNYNVGWDITNVNQNSASLDVRIRNAAAANTSYSYKLTITKRGGSGFSKQVSGQAIGNINVPIPGLDPGTSYSATFMLGERPETMVQVASGTRDEVDIVTPPLISSSQIDFNAAGLPSIIFYNNGVNDNGVKLSFSTNRPCSSKAMITSGGNTVEIRSTNVISNQHQINITRALDFVATNASENVATIGIVLQEYDNNNQPLSNPANIKTFSLGLGGQRSTINVSTERSATRRQAAREVGSAVGTGLCGLIKTVLPALPLCN